MISHLITKKQNLIASSFFHCFRGSLGFSDEFTRVLMGNVGDMDVKVNRSDLDGRTIHRNESWEGAGRFRLFLLLFRWPQAPLAE